MHRRPVSTAAAAIGALPLLLLPPWATSAARAESGVYLQVFGGPSILTDEEYEVDDDFGTIDADRALGTIEPDYELGYNVGGALGYRINDLFRVEAEVAYQSHDLDGGGGGGLAAAIDDLDGDGTILSAMINGYVEGQFGGFPLKPFLGLGVGVARVSLNDIGGTLTLVPAVPVLPVVRADVDDVIDDEDTVFAGQAIAGVSFDVDEHWTTAFSYRFFGAFGAEFETEGVSGIIGAQDFETDFFSHALRFEVRYRL